MENEHIDDQLITLDAIEASGAEPRPFAVLDLRACAENAVIPVLPPFPLIGIGDVDHPLARRLDTVIEPPMSARAVISGIESKPCAASALVQLLRCTDGMDVGHALHLESMSFAMLQGSAEHTDWLRARPPSKSAAPGAVIVRRDDAVLHVMIDRPHARNAIDRAMRDALYEAFAISVYDPDVTAIHLRATGPTFGIGADLAEFGTTRDPATAHLIRTRTLPAAMLVRRPGILNVHVQGGCVGASLEIAAFARRFTATRSAWFQLPELAMGIIPGAGGCVSIPRRIGRQRTALLTLSGRRIDAVTALRWGLIDAIMDAPSGNEGSANEV